ncbi:MAG: YIP1 family protein [bacterium]
MNRLFDVFSAPARLFTNLKEKPKWTMPFIIVLIVIALAAASTVVLTKDAMITRQEEVLKERGMNDEQIEQTKKFMQGPLPVVFGGIGGAIFVGVLLLFFTVILSLFVPVFGGTSGFKSVLTVVSFSALIKVPSAILKIILMAITKSPFVTTSLALIASNLEKTSFVYQLLAGFDFFIIWEMIVVAIGINIINGVKKQNAYVLVFLIWFVSLFIGIGLSFLRGPAG